MLLKEARSKRSLVCNFDPDLADKLAHGFTFFLIHNSLLQIVNMFHFKTKVQSVLEYYRVILFYFFEHFLIDTDENKLVKKLHFHEWGQEFWKQNGDFSLSSTLSMTILMNFLHSKTNCKLTRNTMNNKTGFANFWGWIHIKLRSVLSWKHTTIRLQDFWIRN